MPNSDKQENKNEPYIPEFPKEEARLPNVHEPKPFIGDTSRQVGESTALRNCYNKMEIRNSPLEGFGVFATETIKAGEVLEEIPIIVWPSVQNLSEKFYFVMKEEGYISKEMELKEDIRSMFNLKHPSKYYFKWWPQNVPKKENEFQCLPLGYGPIYNSANGMNNATWTHKEKTFIFTAIRDIYPDEEIFTYYGYMCAEGSATFNIDEVFGFGLEYAAADANGTLALFLRNLRFVNNEDQALRMKEQGVQDMLNALQASRGRVKLKKISVIEGDEEKFPFDFPPEFNLHFTFMKLKEFKETRFKVIKFKISYADVTTRKEVEKDILWINNNG
jgi:hypothetical protein